MSEIEFAAQHTSATLIGITGTNGKTTTTLLTYQILKDAGLHVGLAGNIGNSFALQVAEQILIFMSWKSVVFSWMILQNFAPHIAVITNITPDHLDRYNYRFEAYIQSKLKISEESNRKDFFLFNAEDSVVECIEKQR